MVPDVLVNAQRLQLSTICLVEEFGAFDHNGIDICNDGADEADRRDHCGAKASHTA